MFSLWSGFPPVSFGMVVMDPPVAWVESEVGAIENKPKLVKRIYSRYQVLFSPIPVVRYLAGGRNRGKHGRQCKL